MFKNLCECFRQNLSEGCRATVVRQSYVVRTSFAKWIGCDFFPQNISQDRRTTVVRRSRDVRANVANLSPHSFGEFTMRKFRDTRTNVVRVSHDGRATVLRQHAKNSRLSGEKIKLSVIRTNVVRHSYESRGKIVRHSYECRATIARQS